MTLILGWALEVGKAQSEAGHRQWRGRTRLMWSDSRMEFDC